MTSRLAVLAVALLGAGCTTASQPPGPSPGSPVDSAAGRGGASAGSGGGGSGGAQGGTGGTAGSAGSAGSAGGTGGTGGSVAGTGGSGGAPGLDAAAGAPSPDATKGGDDGGAADGPPSGGTGGSGGAAGGKALMVVGTIPLVGTDVQIRDALRARNLEVEEVRENMATAAQAMGKRVVILSFSMQSDDFKANEAIGQLEVPIISLEHNLLPGLGMTSGPGHGFQLGLTQITITSDDPLLTAGLPMGDVTVYARTQEMFWGVPGPGGIKVASIKGNPGRTAYFAYPKGAMMVGRTAPARRLHFFFAVHAPPPVRELYLNDTGLKLLGGAIDWSMQ